MKYFLLGMIMAFVIDIMKGFRQGVIDEIQRQRHNGLLQRFQKDQRADDK